LNDLAQQRPAQSTNSDLAVLMQPAVTMSLGLELFGFPLLGWWAWRAER